MAGARPRGQAGHGKAVGFPGGGFFCEFTMPGFSMTCRRAGNITVYP